MNHKGIDRIKKLFVLLVFLSCASCTPLTSWILPDSTKANIGATISSPLTSWAAKKIPIKEDSTAAVISFDPIRLVGLSYDSVHGFILGYYENGCLKMVEPEEYSFITVGKRTYLFNLPPGEYYVERFCPEGLTSDAFDSCSCYTPPGSGIYFYNKDDEDGKNSLFEIGKSAPLFLRKKIINNILL